jgi:hypothetical protein
MVWFKPKDIGEKSMSISTDCILWVGVVYVFGVVICTAERERGVCLPALNRMLYAILCII